MNGLHVCLGLSTITGYKDPKSQGREIEKLKITWSSKIQWQFSHVLPDILIVITLWNKGTFPPNPLGEQGCREGWDWPAVRWDMWPVICSDAGKHVCDWPPIYVSPHLLLWAVLMNKRQVASRDWTFYLFYLTSVCWTCSRCWGYVLLYRDFSVTRNKLHEVIRDSVTWWRKTRWMISCFLFWLGI